MELRQLPAACVLSAAVSSTMTSFSASAKVAAETSGPTAGAVPNAGGAPAGGSAGFWAGSCPLVWPNAATVVPSRVRVVCVKNSRRDFDMDFLRGDYRSYLPQRARRAQRKQKYFAADLNR